MFRKIFAVAIMLAVMLTTPCMAATQYPNSAADTDHQEGDFEYSVNLDDTVTIRRYIGDTDVISLDFPATLGGKTVTAIGEYDLAPPMLSNCYALETVTFPETLTSLGNLTFYNTAVTRVVLPENMVFCGYEANFSHSATISSVVLPKAIGYIEECYFKDCTALNEVTIYKECTSIYRDAFKGCDALADVYYGGTKAQWEQILIKDGNEALAKAQMHYIYGSGVGGDVTCDGEISVKDALKLYQLVSGKAVADDAANTAGDMDGNGYLTMRDALCLYGAVASL